MAVIGNSSTQQAFTPAIDFFSGNGSTTAFTLSRPVASVAQVQVTIDNVAQNPSSAYTVSANTITFTSAPLSGTNNVYVYYTSPITQVIAPGQGTVTTTSLTSGLTLASPNITTALTLTGASGTNGQYLTSAGSGNAPTWTTVASSQWTTTGSDIFYNTGVVSIGTAPPAWAGFKVLDVGSVTSLWAQTSGNGTSYYSNNLYYNGGSRIYKTTGGASEYTQSGGSHQWYYASSGTAGNSVSLSEAMRTDSSGRLLIGATSAVSGADANGRVQVSQDVGSNTCILVAENTASSGNLSCIRARLRNSSPVSIFSAFMQCDDSTTARFVLRSDGGLANYSANNVNLSDRQEKKDFLPAKSYLETICAIPVQTFNYIDQTDELPNLGVVAQDVQAVAPELVSESDWSTEKDGSKMRLSVYQTDLQYALMKSIQELKAINDTQAETITALTARITALENK
jgi:hypothetical protein